MADVTRLLDAAAAGDSKASAELFPLVYEELKRLVAAHEGVITVWFDDAGTAANVRVCDFSGFPRRSPLSRLRSWIGL